MTNYFQKGLDQLGGIPVGNASEMHRYARQLRGRAQEFRAIVAEHRKIMASAGLHEGNLATRMKSRAETTSQSIDLELATRTEELANYVDREAVALAEKQQWIKRRATEIGNELRQIDDRARAAAREVQDRIGG